MHDTAKGTASAAQFVPIRIVDCVELMYGVNFAGERTLITTAGDNLSNRCDFTRTVDLTI